MAISIMFLLLKMSVACTGCGYGDFLILKLILYQQGWYQVLFASNPVLKQRQELHSTENPELVFAFKKTQEHGFETVNLPAHRRAASLAGCNSIFLIV